MSGNNFYKILDDFLLDDGEKRDIIGDLANNLGVIVEIVRADFNDEERDFFAGTIINEKARKIVVDIGKIKNYDTRRFIVAYQLAEIIKSNDKEIYSIFEIENINIEVYELAMKIFERSNKYREYLQCNKLSKRKKFD